VIARRFRAPLLVAAALVVVAVAAVVILTAVRSRGSTQPAAATTAAANPADSFHSVRTYDDVAAPVRIRIPAMHVDSKLINLGLQSDGSVAVPPRTDVAGWYDGGPKPGAPGPAVILGHVDSKDGPGIFIDLHAIKAGTEIRVDRADGSSVTFAVTKVQKVLKTKFPTDLVYAPTLDPTLRLVTCGGSFDAAKGSYRDNVIAFAVEK
jgi:sortase (surface protein transpeptidase)